MQKITKYIIVRESNLPALETKVQEHIESNWIPLGQPSTFQNQNGAIGFFQALIQKENIV